MQWDYGDGPRVEDRRTTMIARSRRLSALSAAVRITALISSTVGGSGEYRSPSLRGASPRSKLRRGRGRPAPADAIQQRRGFHDVLLWTTNDQCRDHRRTRSIPYKPYEIGPERSSAPTPGSPQDSSGRTAGGGECNRRIGTPGARVCRGKRIRVKATIGAYATTTFGLCSTSRPRNQSVAVAVSLPGSTQSSSGSIRASIPAFSASWYSRWVPLTPIFAERDRPYFSANS